MAIRKNKKRIDPRYFLHETAHRDELDENVPNIDFQRRAHGGKTCGEWSKKIARLKELYEEAITIHHEQLPSVLDSDWNDEKAKQQEQEREAVPIARTTAIAAVQAAKEQKCQVGAEWAWVTGANWPPAPQKDQNKALQLLKDFGEDFKNWPRDMAELLDRYYGHGKMETDRWERERRAR